MRGLRGSIQQTPRRSTGLRHGQPASPKRPHRLHRPTGGAFSLLEILIVVLLLGILAAIVLPRLSGASDDARGTAVKNDLQTLRQQITLYTAQHTGRGPHLDPDGSLDTVNLIARLLNRTERDGSIAAGQQGLGPYIHKWPANPYADPRVSALVAFGTADQPPRDGSTGWYFNTDTGVISANSQTGGESLDP